MNTKALRDISYGLYAIATELDGKKYGCIVNTVFQITSVNPMICVSVNKNNATHDAIKAAGRFSAAILSDDTDPKVIGTFGFRSSKDTDKFEGTIHSMVGGVPVVKEAVTGYLVCEVVSFVDAETHSLILGRVVEAEKFTNLHPMTYEYYHNVIKGKAPKNAPTYVEEKPQESAASYVCDICGYVYEGDFSKAPDNYVCPICKADKSHFKAK